MTLVPRNRSIIPRSELTHFGVLRGEVTPKAKMTPRIGANGKHLGENRYQHSMRK